MFTFDKVVTDYAMSCFLMDDSALNFGCKFLVEKLFVVVYNALVLVSYIRDYFE